MQTYLALLSFVLSCTAMPGRRQDGPSLCDKYTTALLKENTAANQETVLTLIVNTAIIGNYTSNPGSLVKVDGILAPGTGKYEGVNLAPYFSGAGPTTNRGGKQGVKVNFLDGGGAAPLKKNMPADDEKSNQFFLVSHLYSYFAGLLGCSQYGKTVSAYEGSISMYQVHKFMDLDSLAVGWFIEQVGLSAASFGVSSDDVAAVGKSLSDTFGKRCSRSASIPASSPPMLQSICIAPDCPLADNPVCSAYCPPDVPLSYGGM
ncbi:hypothetical protein CERZMDRAFT_122899 [Cercospora zeae-maydis SCOH1-5]|uniref:Tyrosinase copper-binding domain-containing protein n=1 Tax=Cercospora zeae-maydis SCOH1-5 TaxID=717836 RepID=A0A6A6F0I9_9PEZI|nr:hypothetical protein CERZMDRAFT_122899 [Cercospora zeae-maydis SCOH1-5]